MSRDVQRIGKVFQLPVRKVRVEHPSAEESEKTFLTLAFMDAEDGAYMLIDMVSVLRPEHFYNAQRGAVWAWMVRQIKANLPCSTIAFLDEYAGAGEDAQTLYGSLSDVVGGSTEGASFDLHGYGRLVIDAGNRRAIMAACMEGAQKCHEMEAPEALAHVKRLLAALESSVVPSTDARTMQTVAMQWSSAIQREQQDLRAGKPSGLSNGFKRLDDFGPIRPGFVQIYAARPGMGKSALLFSMAIRMAREIRYGQRGGVVICFALEMPEDQLMDRWVSESTGIPYSIMHEQVLTQDQHVKMDAAAAVMANLPMLVQDKPAVTIEYIRRYVQSARARWGHVHAVFIDYLQLVRTDQKFHNRNEEVAHISREMKTMAKEFNTIVLAAAQINRASEARTDKRPLMSELRESGQIEQDADRIFGIFRPGHYAPDGPQNVLEVLCLKNRHGKTGTAFLGWRNGVVLDAPDDRYDGYGAEEYE